MTTLTQITSTQGAKETSVNNQHSALSPAAFLGRRAEAITGLTFAYYGGVIWANGGWRSIADGTLSMTASDTNYVELDIEGDATDPAVSSNIVGFTDGAIPLYEIVTDGTDITSYTDRRVALSLQPQGHDIQVIAYAASITPDALAGKIVQVGQLTGAITVNAPSNPFTGAELIFLFEQEGGSPDPLHAVTWNSVFNAPTDSGGNAGEAGAVHFVYDASAAAWVQVGGALEWN